MVKIDLELAYDSFTQKSLFMAVCEENLSPESDFTPRQIEDAKKRFGSWDDITQMTEDLLFFYKANWQDELDKIDYKLRYYVMVDYSQMLREDIYNGYLDLIQCNDGSLVTYLC